MNKLGCLLSAVVVGAILRAAPAGPAGRVTVEADMFSGRPNPMWRMTAQESAELRRRLAHLRPAPTGSVLKPPVLGYRGLRITVYGRRTTDLYQLRDGLVRDKAGRLFVDDDRQLERWILKSARRRVEPEIETLLNREVNR